MSDYEVLLARFQKHKRWFDQAVAELQASCPHEDVTEWLTGWGYDSKLCKNCNKQVATRSQHGEARAYSAQLDRLR